MLFALRRLWRFGRWASLAFSIVCLPPLLLGAVVAFRFLVPALRSGVSEIFVWGLVGSAWLWTFIFLNAMSIAALARRSTGADFAMRRVSVNGSVYATSTDS